MKVVTVFAGLLMAGVVTMGAVDGSQAALTPNARGYSAGKYELFLDGTPNGGFVRQLAGGSPYADVITEAPVGPAQPKMHLGPVQYEPLSFQCGTGMAAAFYAWLKDTLDHRLSRKNGGIAMLDFDYNELSRLSFLNGSIAEIGFPALDAASKDLALLTVTIAAESTRRTTSSGKNIAAVSGDTSSTTKKWLAANFKLAIDNMPTTKVNKIDPLVFRQKIANVAESETPGLRQYAAAAAPLVMPRLSITLAESDAASWYTWYNDFVVQGNSGDASEKNGTLIYLAQDLSTPFFTLSFKHMGIVKIASATSSDASDPIRRVKIDLYFEDVTLTIGATTAN